MKIIICKPGKPAKSVTIKVESLTLRTMQQIVEGNIEVVHADGMPQGTVIVCNADGKLLGLPLNMEIQLGGVPDVICGTFLICGDSGEDLEPLEEKTAARIMARLVSAEAPINVNKTRCSLCGQEFEGYGNNAWPLSDGECCDSCNEGLVIPERIKQIEADIKNLDTRLSKKQTLEEGIEMLRAEICKNYCKYPEQIEDEDELAVICIECPLVTEL